MAVLMRSFVVIALLSTFVNASHKESVRLISLNADLSLRDLELIDVHPNFLRRRAQIEQTTGALLELINRHKILNNHVFPFGSIVYGKSDHPDWSYENYLAHSVLHVVSREIQFFEACYFEEYGGLQPVACFMPVRRKTLCEEKKLDKFVHAVRQQVQSEIRSTGDEKNDIAVVRSIFLSNCGEHQKASTLLLKLTQNDPTNPYYRFVLSELLSRQDKRKLGLALEHINEAVRLNSSEVQYREKRLTLYLSHGLIDDARLDAEWIRAHVEEHLRGKYCTYCSRKRVKKTVPPLDWRPWFVLGLFDLIASNGTQAERDFTVALDLALSVKLRGDQEISFSVSSILRHLKAISLHNVNKFADAMETAVLNAHVNPSALDAVLLISQTLARASMFDRALIMLDLALPLMDSISISASSAGYVEVLTDVLSIRRVTLQLRSWIHYRLGNILEAEADARSCLELLPTDALCSYIHAICMLVSGRFVETLKSAAPVISRAFDIRVNNTPEFVYLNYLKEWVRYTYQHLTLPMSQFHWLSNLPNAFKQSWIKAIQLSSVVGYIEQPGIDYELRGFLLTPQYMHSLLSGNSSAVRLHAPQPFESHDPKRQANLTDSCPTSSRLLQMSPPECLRSQLKELSDALCLLDATFSLILASGSTSNPRSMPLVNRRHRLAFVLGALHGAEFIRNYWCQRRRVSFTTCWSYTSDIETPYGRHRAQSFERSDYYSEQNPEWGDTVGYCSDQSENARHQFRRRKSCRSPQPEGPDWFVVTSLTTQLLLLTDPYDVPAIWYADTQAESDSFDNSPHRFWTRGYNTPDQTAGKQTDSMDTGEDEPENDWYGASIREQRHFVQHGQYVVENMAYAPNALQLLCSFVEFRALLSPKTSGSGFSSEIFPDSRPHMEDWSSHSSLHFDTSDFISSGTPNVTTPNKLLQSMTRVWLMADQFGLLDHHNRVTLKVHVPGRADLAHSASSDSSRKRYLASILLFEKDLDRNYALSILLLSNRQHREDLGAEMDAAFSDYLVEGEKALATILANSNFHQGPRRMTSPLKDTYLANAVNSAFYWLYYWSVLKPLASVYSFHVGFSMLLGMLRALGVEPKSSLSDTERNLELEALFVGSPEAFAKLCFSVLHVGWLSQTSVSLTWLITPDEWMRTPKDFIELLNLYSITDCGPS